MGQAKARGTFEQRRAAALEREKTAKAEQLEWERSRGAVVLAPTKIARVNAGTVGRLEGTLLLAAMVGMSAGLRLRSR